MTVRREIAEPRREPDLFLRIRTVLGSAATVKTRTDCCVSTCQGHGLVGARPAWAERAPEKMSEPRRPLKVYGNWVIVHPLPLEFETALSIC